MKTFYSFEITLKQKIEQHLVVLKGLLKDWILGQDLYGHWTAFQKKDPRESEKEICLIRVLTSQAFLTTNRKHQLLYPREKLLIEEELAKYFARYLRKY